MNKKMIIPLVMILSGIIIGAICAIVLGINNFEPTSIDVSFRDFCYNTRGEKFGLIYWIFRILTEFGFVYVVLVVFIVFTILVKADIRSAVLGFGSLITWVSNTVIKALFMRERPMAENRWMDEHSSSFPSGHSMTATFVYGMLIYYVLTSKYFEEKKNKKIILIVVFAALIPIVMYSRMILGVHYFTDVITGFGYGMVCVGIAIILDMYLNRKGFKFVKGLIIKHKEKNKNSE